MYMGVTKHLLIGMILQVVNTCWQEYHSSYPTRYLEVWSTITYNSIPIMYQLRNVAKVFAPKNHQRREIRKKDMKTPVEHKFLQMCHGVFLENAKQLDAEMGCHWNIAMQPHWLSNKKRWFQEPIWPSYNGKHVLQLDVSKNMNVWNNGCFRVAIHETANACFF